MGGPTEPTNRENVTDNEQDILENAEFEGGSPVFDNGKTRVVAKGAQTATQKTSNGGSNIGSNAGVIFPHDDRPGSFLGDTIGRP